MATRDGEHVEHAAHTKAGTKASASDHQVTPSEALLKRPLPAESIAKARSAFKNFSLSKFAGQSTPSNYVPAGETPAAVHRKIIAQHMQKLSEEDTSNQGMTLALPTGEIKNFLPSYSEKGGTAALSDVLSLLTKKMSGTEFYANGNPTLNRLALQSQVDQIIQSVKQETKK
jgi:hypothetical protein